VPKKRVSIKDIAAAAGVSHPTVSRALRGKGRMSTSTRERILQLAKEMGYTPSLIARGLVTQRTDNIGLIVADISDPFYSEIIRGVEHVIRENSYSLFLGSAVDDPDQEASMVRSFLGRHVDGLIVTSSKLGNRYLDILDAVGTPLVLINSHMEGTLFHSVNHQDYHGTRKLLSHLLDRGHRRIAYLGNRSAGRSESERQRAWKETLQAANLPADVMASCENFRIQSGYDGLGKLLDRARDVWGALPDAIVANNDLIAIGAIKALQDAGLKVPDDIAVTGFDDIEVAAFTSPTLTTLRQPRYEMGVKAAQVLLELLSIGTENGRPQPQEITFIGDVIVRESA
jgi:DNA-binding LacI/PurR family transcriptional regulator